MDFDVFLSHNGKDKPTVEEIAKKLQQKYSLRCWLDKWNSDSRQSVARRDRRSFGSVSNVCCISWSKWSWPVGERRDARRIRYPRSR